MSIDCMCAVSDTQVSVTPYIVEWQAVIYLPTTNHSLQIIHKWLGKQFVDLTDYLFLWVNWVTILSSLFLTEILFAHLYSQLGFVFVNIRCGLPATGKVT